VGQRPRVIVVEDDETLGEFFGLVLETMPVAYRVCRCAEDALDELRTEPADVLVTDLLLPGLDGRGLLKVIRHEGRLRGPARLVVMSGSIDDNTRREMTQLGVWQVLAKPVTVKAFKACIAEALAPRADASDLSSNTENPQALTPKELEVVATLFGGNEPLFLAYRKASLEQFPRDVAQGERALHSHDVAGLRRVAHNLKSVLKTLGYDELSQTAKELEDAAAHWLETHQGGLAPGQAPHAVGTELPQLWSALKDGLTDQARFAAH
jgi:DNA-binding response OmpR family regulator